MRCWLWYREQRCRNSNVDRRLLQERCPRKRSATLAVSGEMPGPLWHELTRSAPARVIKGFREISRERCRLTRGSGLQRLGAALAPQHDTRSFAIVDTRSRRHATLPQPYLNLSSTDAALGR